MPEEEKQERLSELVAQHGWSDYKDEISGMVHDALAIEHYPNFADWQKEYTSSYAVFQAMQQSRLKLKSLVGSEYERFIQSHRDL